MNPSKILVYRMGHLGDTMATIPTVQALQKAYPQAKFYLWSQTQKGRVIPRDIFGDQFFDGYFTYKASMSFWERLFKPFRLLWLWVRLKLAGIDLMVYLPMTDKSEELMAQDRRFFRFAGIRHIVGLERPIVLPQKESGKPMRPVKHQADFFLEVLGQLGLEVPAVGNGSMDMEPGDKEKQEVDRVLAGLGVPRAGRWLAVAPGAKKKANVWPRERYEEVVRRLLEKYDLLPVVFGSDDERGLGDSLITQWGKGINLSGLLSVRGSAEALGRCVLYLGNDTGTTHLAAAAKIPCICVFASQEAPGLWYPYGSGHQVFRTVLECEGCHLGECIEKKMECIRSITVEEVYQACDEKLSRLKA